MSNSIEIGNFINQIVLPIEQTKVFDCQVLKEVLRESLHDFFLDLTWSLDKEVMAAPSNSTLLNEVCTDAAANTKSMDPPMLVVGSD